MYHLQHKHTKNSCMLSPICCYWGAKRETINVIMSHLSTSVWRLKSPWLYSFHMSTIAHLILKSQKCFLPLLSELNTGLEVVNSKISTLHVITDANQALQCGTYRFGPGAGNVPLTGSGIIYCIGTDRVIQVCREYYYGQNNHDLYVRCAIDAIMGWTPWRKLQTAAV